MNWTNKPKNTSINLSDMKPADLEYYCTTKNIDRLVCKGVGLVFDEAIAEAMEKDSKFYFVVKKNREYDVKSGILFEAWLKGHCIVADGADVPEKTDQIPKAGACIEHFVMQLIKQRKNKK